MSATALDPNKVNVTFKTGVLKIFRFDGGTPPYHKWNLELYVPGIWHAHGRTWLDMDCCSSITWDRHTRGGGIRVFGFGVGFAVYKRYSQ